MDVLGKNCTPSFHHVFWPQEVSQLTDAILLDLAIRKGGRLVTMISGSLTCCRRITASKRHRGHPVVGAEHLKRLAPTMVHASS